MSGSVLTPFLVYRAECLCPNDRLASRCKGRAGQVSRPPTKLVSIFAVEELLSSVSNIGGGIFLGRQLQDFACFRELWPGVAAELFIIARRTATTCSFCNAFFCDAICEALGVRNPRAVKLSSRTLESVSPSIAATSNSSTFGDAIQQKGASTAAARKSAD